MTDEFPKTVTVDNFFSGGPTFYRFNGRNNETAAEYNVFEVKDLTINRAVEKTFDIEEFKKLVLLVHELRSPFSSMRRCVKTQSLRSIQTQFCKEMTKITCTKRCFDTDTGLSVPYGFLSNFKH